MDEQLPADLAREDAVWDEAVLGLIVTGSTDATVAEAAARELSTIGEAEWAMRALGELDRAHHELQQQAGVWREQITHWYETQVAPVEARRAFLRRKLEAFGVTRRRENPREATIPLPSGEIATTQQREPRVVQIADEDAEAELIAWCAEILPGFVYEDVIKTTESVRISELRKLVEIVTSANDDGETIYAVTYTPPETDEDPTPAPCIVPGVYVEPPATTAKAKPLT